MAFSIGPVPTEQAMAFLKAWQDEIEKARQDPNYKDACFACGHVHTSPRPREEWDCRYCGCC